MKYDKKGLKCMCDLNKNELEFLIKEMVDMEKNKGRLATHAEPRQWLINFGTNSSLSTSVSPVQLVINQVSKTPQCAAQYSAQPPRMRGSTLKTIGYATCVLLKGQTSLRLIR